MTYEDLQYACKNTPDFAAARFRAINNMRAYGEALRSLKLGRWVTAEVGTKAENMTVDLTGDPDVIRAMEVACERMIAKANEDLLQLGGHLIQ